MSVFSNLFGSSEKQDNSSSKINWIPLTDLGQLNEIISASSEKPVLIFKHSTRCSISSMALNRLERNWAGHEEKLTPYYLDLITFRDVRNHIATLSGVQHESPQAIVVKNGEVVYHASHNGISLADMMEVLG
jgi:bacillithiol system protein YtxJ